MGKHGNGSRWNLSKFVALKDFASEFLSEEPCCRLDISVYMLESEMSLNDVLISFTQQHQRYHP